jgi:hypothetical protein
MIHPLKAEVHILKGEKTSYFKDPEVLDAVGESILTGQDLFLGKIH